MIAWSRLDRRRHQTVALGVIALIIAIAFFPMRLAISLSDLGKNGVEARAIEGSIWSATIRDLNIGSVPVGDVRARLHFLPLFLGRSQLSLWREAGPATLPIRSVIGARSGGFAMKDTTADLPVADALAPLPLSRVRFNEFTAIMADGECKEASGIVELEMTPSLFGAVLRRGLSGQPSCRNGALYLPLKGQSALENFEVTIRADGSYTAQLTLNGLGGEWAAPLAAAGFSTVGDDAVALTASGKLR